MSLSQDITNLVTATNNLTSTVDGKIAEIDNHVNTAIDTVVNSKSVTYYVDALNGNDNNDGSSASPFQTIKKACDSVPVGGNGAIHLAQNQTYYISSNITLANKRISIDNTNSIIENVSYVSGSNTETYGFYLFFSEIQFRYGTIKTADLVTDSNGSVLPISIWEGFIKRHDFTHGYVKTYVTFIELGDTSFIRRASGGNSSDLHMYGGSVNRVGQNLNGYLIYNEIGDFRFSAHAASLGTENDGTTGLTWSGLVSGIVKDSNGVPRNVISNITF